MLIVGMATFMLCSIFTMGCVSRPDQKKNSKVLSISANWLKERFDMSTSFNEDQALIKAITSTYQLKRNDLSPGWSVYGKTLDGKKYIEFNGKTSMRSASVIKPFIVSAAYEYCLYPQNGAASLSLSETEKNEIRSLSKKAVSESDNEAANALILLIGEGDKNKGFNRINAWCQNKGFSKTSIGRLFLEANPTGDNYTSAFDCVKLLTDVYQKKLINAETSSELLEFLMEQSDRGKIPRYIDDKGVIIANKTGELNADYGLGFVDSDMALVYNEKGGFVLAVLMGDENNHFEETNETISLIAKNVFDTWLTK